MGRIAINGKFIGAPLNGVHRTAALYSKALCAHAASGTDVEVLAPRALPEDSCFRNLAPRVLKSSLGTSQLWESLALPLAARGRLLVNFCNLAPVLHPRYVVMIHDAQTFLYPGDYSSRQAVAYRAFLPWVGHRAARVLTVSDFARDSLVEHRIAPAECIRVVYNGTDHLLATEADDAALDLAGLVPGSFALALGSTKRYKNLARLFAVFQDPALSEFPLVVAGGPPRQAYEARGMTPPAGARFLGTVSDGALRSLYSGAAVFLFPSLTEGFGLPPIEAMHCGAPVIASRAGAMIETCGSAAILVNPHDTAAWREAVLSLVHDPAARAIRSRQGFDQAKRFTWERAGRVLWEAISDLVG